MGCISDVRERICSLPHGLYTFVPVSLIFCSFCLSIASFFRCSLVEVRSRDVESDDDQLVIYLGVWLYRIGDSTACRPYDSAWDTLVDLPWKMSTAFSGVSTVLGGICLLSLITSTCIPFDPAKWRLIAVGLIIACVAEGLTFVFLYSDVCGKHFTCILSLNAWTTGISSVGYLTSSLTLMSIPSPKVATYRNKSSVPATTKSGAESGLYL